MITVVGALQTINPALLVLAAARCSRSWQQPVALGLGSPLLCELRRRRVGLVKVNKR